MASSMAKKVAVVAIGGNSLIRDAAHQSIRDQLGAVRETVGHIVCMVEQGWNVVITHGNGPQVGAAIRRSELAAQEVYEEPLDVCVADTQGSIGYLLQQTLVNAFQRAGVCDKPVITVITQAEVSPDDPAFAQPSKPIGSFMDEATAHLRRERDGWHVAEDAGRGWRRLVASPAPLRVIEQEAIRDLVSCGYVVISVGGGGVPVVRDAAGALAGTAAVIDKDHATALLASGIGADLLLISTAVERVALHFGTPRQTWLDRVCLEDLRGYLSEGHFKPGSMLPKIQAVIHFLEQGGKAAVITSPEKIEAALAGQAGTWIVP